MQHTRIEVTPKELKTFPRPVQPAVGLAIYAAQLGEMPLDAKPSRFHRFEDRTIDETDTTARAAVLTDFIECEPVVYGNYREFRGSVSPAPPRRRVAQVHPHRRQTHAAVTSGGLVGSVPGMNRWPWGGPAIDERWHRFQTNAPEL